MGRLSAPPRRLRRRDGRAPIGLRFPSSRPRRTCLSRNALSFRAAGPLAVELKRNVAAASKARLVDSPGEAQAVLGFTEELREKIILSFSAAGRVSEYQLRYRVGFRVTDAKGAQVYLPTGEIQLTRDMAYSDAQVLAKEAEEALLYRDMQRTWSSRSCGAWLRAKPALPAVEVSAWRRSGSSNSKRISRVSSSPFT